MTAYNMTVFATIRAVMLMLYRFGAKQGRMQLEIGLDLEQYIFKISSCSVTDAPHVHTVQ